ncbi:MAG: hypothetical protein AAF641_04520 [Pseudomonadota bacterium]
MKYTQEYFDNIERNAPYLLDHARYLEVLSNESDRGAVLVTAQMLDNTLEKLLRARLAEGKGADKLLKDEFAPLGTFSAKIAAAHALAIVPENWRRELDLLRDIRNKLAHSITARLDDQSILDKCNALRLCLPNVAKDAASARRRYWESATLMIFNSLNHLNEGGVWRIPSPKEKQT